MSPVVRFALVARFAVASGFVRVAPAPLSGFAVRRLASAARAADDRLSR